METRNQIEKKISDLEVIIKEVRELRKVNQELLELEEKNWQEKEQVKKREAERKKSVEESPWWKKITAYASIITAITTILHFVFQIWNLGKIKNL